MTGAVAIAVMAAVAALPLHQAAAKQATRATVSSMTDFKSIGYTAYWDQRRALTNLPSAAKGGLDEVSPSWYAPTADGQLVFQEAARVPDEVAAVAAIKAAGLRVVPAIANYREKQWDTTSASAMLSSPAARQRLIDETLTKVRAFGYDGIDLDLEHGVAADRQNYVRLARDMAAALHAEGKTLSVTVHPKQAEPGPQPKNQAQSYAQLGAVADEFRIMLYDYHWETSAPGAVAPFSWVRSVTRFAVTQVPAHKIVLGFATYGYDWPPDGAGESQMHAELAAIAAARSIPITYDRVGGSKFSYQGHQVWLEDVVSLQHKVRLAREFRVRGVHLWRLGGEDPRIWSSGILK